VERLKRLYEIYKAEADACIARGLVIPAHDYVLRQSHTFNLLDARGAIGVTERAKFFADMRAQAKPSPNFTSNSAVAWNFPG
jgi:glycyl-tRNA synthetase